MPKWLSVAGQCIENAVYSSEHRGKCQRLDQFITMSKRRTKSTATNSATAVTTKATTGRVPPNDVKFPELSTKKGLDCRVLLESQVLLIDVRTMAWGTSHDHLTRSFSELVFRRRMRTIRQVH